MQSKRKQFNVRLSDEGLDRLGRLVSGMKGALGIDVSQADVIHAALVELEKKYPLTTEQPEPPRKPPAGGKPRKRKEK